MRSTPWYWMALKLREKAQEARWRELVGSHSVSTIAPRVAAWRAWERAVAEREEWEMVNLPSNGNTEGDA